MPRKEPTSVVYKTIKLAFFVQTTGFLTRPSLLLKEPPIRPPPCPPTVRTSPWPLRGNGQSHALGKGRGLTPHFSFSQKSLPRSNSISLARIWVPEELKPPWSSYSSSGSSSWSSPWPSPSDCALHGSRWPTRPCSPARSPPTPCERLLLLLRGTGQGVDRQGRSTRYPGWALILGNTIKATCF